MFQQSYSGPTLKLVCEPVFCLVVNSLQPFISARLQHAQHPFSARFVVRRILGTLYQLRENDGHQLISILQKPGTFVGIESFFPQTHEGHKYTGQPAVKSTR